MKTHHLKIYRQNSGLSLDTLSKKINLTPASISRIENFLQGMTVKTCMNLEKVSGIPAYSWLWPDEFPHPKFKEPLKKEKCHVSASR